MTEQDVWKELDPDHLWVLDKLILSRKLGYVCGPTGTDVPAPGKYIVRPCVNAFGLGLGASVEYIEKSTDHLTPGHFWCEFFEGRHFSVDYKWGLIKLIVEGFKKDDTFVKWDKWAKVDDFSALERILSFPKVLDEFISWPIVNIEFIGSKIIEVHFRENPDFAYDNSEFIPVWEEPSLSEHLEQQQKEYQYVECPDVHGRIGAFIK